jgi:hypothetical protein
LNGPAKRTHFAWRTAMVISYLTAQWFTFLEHAFCQH